MQKVGRFYLHKKLKICSLKNQISFNFVNKYGKKFIARSLTLVSYSLQNNIASIKFYEGKVYHNKSHNLNQKIYLGLKVSKKCGNAVIRNKIKRRIKSCIREIINQYYKTLDITALDRNCYLKPINTSLNKRKIISKSNNPFLSRIYLIIPHKHFINVSYSEFKNELTNLLKLLV